MKVALVHDWLVNYTGSERCVKAFSEIYADSPIYTSVYDREAVQPFADREVLTSFIQNLPGALKHHAFYIYLMPLAFERFDFHDADVVLSSSHACAKGVITPPTTLHICYCHTPTRYVWDFFHRYMQEPSYFGIFNELAKLVAPLMLTYLRLWDRTAADRVDHFIANSSFVAQRIRKYYRKEATVINPPVDCANFAIHPDQGDYFLLVSRLVQYKTTDVAVKAFNELGLPLIIAGDGPEYAHLKAMAKKNIRFVGNVTEAEKRDLMAKAQAFIFPPEEDFGITPVESMAAGRPVIAYGRGGALGTVVAGKTGLFFHEQTPASLIEAVQRFDSKQFDPKAIRKHALQFDRESFKTKMQDFITTRYALHQQKNPRPSST